MKTQNIPLEFLAPAQEKPNLPDMSAEDFQAALKSLMTKDLKEEAVVDDPEINDLDEQDTPADEQALFLMHVLPAIENQPQQLTIQMKIPGEVTNDLNNESSNITVPEHLVAESQVDLVDQVLTKTIDSLPNPDKKEINPFRKINEEPANFMQVDTQPVDPSFIKSEDDLSYKLPTLSNLMATEAEVIEIEGQPLKVNLTDEHSSEIKQPEEKMGQSVLPENKLDIPEKIASPVTDAQENIEELAIKPTPLAEEVITDEKMDSSFAVKDESVKFEVQPEATKINDSILPNKMELPVQVEATTTMPEEQSVAEIETFIVSEMQTTNTMEKVSTARIQLKPDHLGEMEIELVIKDKTLTAKLVVEHAETKQWLEQKMQELTNNLAMQDIKVDDFQITVTPPQSEFMGSSFEDNPFFQQKEKSFNQNQKKIFHKEQETQQPEAITHTSKQLGAGRLSIWA